MAPPSKDQSSTIPLFFWLIVIGSVLSLGGGATLLFLSQSGNLGINAGEGPGIRNEEYTAAELVDIWRNESWHAGTVVGADGIHYRVHYDEANVFKDETVDASRLRPRAR